MMDLHPVKQRFELLKSRIFLYQYLVIFIIGWTFLTIRMVKEFFFRAVTNDKGVMGRSFYLLQTGQAAKFRSEISGARESIGDFRIHYNRIVSKNDELNLGIKDYKNLRVKDLQYIWHLCSFGCCYIS